MSPAESSRLHQALSTSSILRGLVSIGKKTQTRKVTSKACKTSISNQSEETILDGLVLLGDGLLSRLSPLCQYEVRFG
jgi:hypothetical protein